jgi:hypothetical protein
MMTFPDHLWLTVLSYLRLDDIYPFLKYPSITECLPQVTKIILKNEFNCQNIHQLELPDPIQGSLLTLIDLLIEKSEQININIITYKRVLEELKQFINYSRNHLIRELITPKTEILIELIQNTIDYCHLIRDDQFIISIHNYFTDDQFTDPLIEMLPVAEIEQLRNKMLELLVKTTRSPILKTDTVTELYSFYAEQNVQYPDTPEIFIILNSLASRPIITQL